MYLDNEIEKLTESYSEINQFHSLVRQVNNEIISKCIWKTQFTMTQ